MPATPTTHRRPTVANKPTPRQLRYLRSLAERTGQTFTYPHTATEAGREIDRLKGVRPESRAERRIERKDIADQLATGPADSARVREDEISGRGSSATWAHNHQRDPEPTSDRPAPKRATPVVGKRTELARYTVAEGERVVYGQRVDGVVRVTDRPATPGGRRRSYLVERGLEKKSELDALVASYVAEAERTGAPPLARRPGRYQEPVA
jgi:hypothetical protein